jgi:hypothetical protein
MGRRNRSVNKFRNIRTGTYASKKEAKRAAELRLLEKAGVILELREQYKFELIPKQEGERAVHYVADFVYYDNEKKCSVVEDVKGFRTRDYIIKRKLFQQKYGYRITEI